MKLYIRIRPAQHLGGYLVEYTLNGVHYAPRQVHPTVSAANQWVLHKIAREERKENIGRNGRK